VGVLFNFLLICGGHFNRTVQEKNHPIIRLTATSNLAFFTCAYLFAPLASPSLRKGGQMKTNGVVFRSYHNNDEGQQTVFPLIYGEFPSALGGASFWSSFRQ
jgi:hypothetical protein